MNFDGHFKISQAALGIVGNSCSTFYQFCQVLRENERMSAQSLIPLSSAPAAGKEWLAWWLRKKLKLPAHSLALQVMGVDSEKEYASTQYEPSGQRYHFMRASNESETEAYWRGCKHIQDNLYKWVRDVRAVHREFDRKAKSLGLSFRALSKPEAYDFSQVRLPSFVPPNPYKGPTMCADNSLAIKDAEQAAATAYNDLKTYQKSLALALHALQDSFSPGHTLRKSGKLTDEMRLSEEAPLIIPDGGDGISPAPLRRIYDYSKQNQNQVYGRHAVADDYGGSMALPLARLATRACAELLSLGLDAILQDREVTSFENFRLKWLKWESAKDLM